MALVSDHILSLVTFLPLAGALVILLCLARRPTAAGWLACGVALADLGLAVLLWLGYDPVPGTDQFVERAAWFLGGRVQYHLACDGISLVLVLLTALLGPLVILSTKSSLSQRVPLFMAMALFLQTAMIGTFLARDMLLFYVFWELMLIPMYFLIGIWGGPRRIYAAVKFFIFTMAGSVFMLVAILYCWFKAGTMDLGAWLALDLTPTEQLWLFAAFALAFAIKVPIWPLHTWLPDAHVEAPTAGSVILAGVLLKMGTYGLLRYAMPLFPAAAVTAAPVLAVLGVIGIVFGALVAWVQTDVKKLVAYSSVSHLGFVVLGLFSLTAQGATGGVFQMLAHGLSTGGLFLLVGILYERRHTRELADFGGLAHGMPAYASVFLITTLASIGLPGLCGFVGEFLILLGTFGSSQLPHAKLLVAVAATGVILGAIYMLWMYQKVFLGPLGSKKNQGLPDLALREWFVLVPLVVFMVWLGVGPNLVLAKVGPSVERVLEPLTAPGLVLPHGDPRPAPLWAVPAVLGGGGEVAP
ncbi:MAG TPA: NADH-quinone oxidoreductase subunit M [Candidatus Krumholzibacteria bacterium]|nr:NADH-quinone oxidoreductase subunit M [Candidatus Krumholzibacteria bacterium]HPD71424.1 NADH-quinone oxidoreductase subunit M [Candidatus Krumholzibacteria bacterium]HRY41643.1 NADH-quinone oxidoreductase subunit M [Candidatus Krumholzibacteria bacterium]